MKLSEVIARQTEKKTGGQTLGDRPRTPVDKRALKVIRTRETPNPNALQFVLNAQILETGNKSYSSLDDCGDDKLGRALFKNDAVKNVYIMKNFVTVTKQDTAGWNPLKTQIWNVIDELVVVYPSEEAAKTANVDVSDFNSLPQEKKLEAIEMVLNRSIRSQLAQDGGGVVLQGMEGKEVHIHYQGACENCPSSMTGTLQHIEKLIKQQLDRDLVVKSV